MAKSKGSLSQFVTTLPLPMSSTTAISAINAINTIDVNDGTVNVVGRDQITINNFHVDHNCNTGKLMKQSFQPSSSPFS